MDPEKHLLHEIVAILGIRYPPANVRSHSSDQLLP
jgi:hypothetical protein